MRARGGMPSRYRVFGVRTLPNPECATRARHRYDPPRVSPSSSKSRRQASTRCSLRHGMVSWGYTARWISRTSLHGSDAELLHQQLDVFEIACTCRPNLHREDVRGGRSSDNKVRRIIQHFRPAGSG